MYIRADIWSCEIRFARTLIVNVYKIGGFCFAGSVFKRYWYLSPFLTLWKAWRLLCIFLLPFFFLFVQCVNQKRKNLFAAKVKLKHELCNDVTAKSEEKFCKTAWDLKNTFFLGIKRWTENGHFTKRIRNNPSFLRLWRISHKTYERKIWCRLLNTAGTVM